MATVTHERLISADDHVDLAHDSVKAHLASKYHDAYDAALREFAAIHDEPALRRGEPALARAATSRRAVVTGRDGHGPRPHRLRRRRSPDAKARLADMDRDGVDASVTYCEVSAFRYLYLVRDGRKESTRAFNTALAEFAAEDPTPADRLVPDPDPRRRRRRSPRCSGRRRAAASRCSFRCSRPSSVSPTTGTRATSRCSPRSRRRGSPICCHIGMNTMLDDLAQRDPTPQKGIFVPMVPLSAAESLGMWIMGGVFEKFPRTQGRVRRARSRMGVVVAVHRRRSRDAGRATSSRRSPSCRATTSAGTSSSRSSTNPTRSAQARGRLGVENVMWSSDYPHPVTSFPNSKAIVDAMFADADPRERELIVSGNAARVWNL